MDNRKSFGVMGLWLFASVAIALARSGLDADGKTRVAILGYLALCLLAYWVWGRQLRPRNPKGVFLALSLLGAMLGETAYMISRPLHPSLLVTPGMSASETLHRTAIDLTLTFPAYICIFLVIWWFARRYRYSAFSFFVVMGLGQALGDGQAYFLANPFMLLFLPYVMSNYWAMTFVPFLVVREQLPADRKPAGVLAHLAPLVALPVTYFVVAAVILTLGAKLGWVAT
jgi:hypothetical protein